jgi:type II secretory ATPase GspE/PulE/Tfp pilus assembly ATPase PilB-like protein
MIRNADKGTAKTKSDGSNAASKYELLESGFIDAGSEAFRKICLVKPNGFYRIAQGYAYEDAFLTERDQLVSSGKLPAQTDFEAVSLDEIAKLSNKDALKDAISELTKKLGGGAERGINGVHKLFAAFEAAARIRASDLKINVKDNHTLVRVKVAGKPVQLGEHWTPEEGGVAITYAFDKKAKNSGETSMTTGGYQSFSITRAPDFPLPENVPKVRGEKGFRENKSGLGTRATFRLFYSDDDANTGTLEDLGFDKETLDALEYTRLSNIGCVFVGGSTGDGKSTTLIRMIEAMYAERDGQIDVMSVEDPVEYLSDLPFFDQIPVKSAGDEDERRKEFSSALRHAMRSSPDACIVSEIRDLVGAKEALQFASSGHKLLTTVHVNSANKILFRLIEMGVPPRELGGNEDIELLMKQTLVPLLCEGCKRPGSDETYARSDRFFEVPEQTRLFERNPEGCPQCTAQYSNDLGRKVWAGFARLSAVAEIIEPDETYMGFVGRQDEAGARAHWLKPAAHGGLGGKRLSEKILDMVIAGQVDVNDAIRIVGRGRRKSRKGTVVAFPGGASS